MESTFSLAREAMVLLAALSGPFLGGLLATGLVVGVAQAMTQVNDPAVGFLPRLSAGIGALWAFGPYALEQLARFLHSSVERGIGGGP